MKRMLLILLSVFLLYSGHVSGQKSEKEKQRQMFYNVLDYMYEADYDKALDILFHLDSVDLKPFVRNADKRFYVNKGDTSTIEKIYVKYLIAACYFEDRSKTQKPLEYIEYVINSGYSETPEIVYKDLGDLYHRDYQFDKAIYYYDKFIEETNRHDYYYDYVKRKIKVSKQARKILKDTLDAPIFELNDNINTPYSEKYPLISQDHSTLVFDYTEYAPTATDRKKVRYYTIKACHKKLGVWQKAQELSITLPKGINYYRLAGLSPDARYIYLAIARDRESPKDLYRGKLKNYSIEALEELKNLNSPSDENFITINTDMDRVYFSSNRDEGPGGYDLYTAEKGTFTNWKNITPLDKPINTKHDEINPFLHPNKKILYFSSNRPKSIGELDIFFAGKSGEKWQKPVNIGFPINTVVNNYAVSINPKQNKLYFSLEKTDDYTNHDIYSTNLNTSIPYTALNGLLMFEDKNKPVMAKIKVSFVNEKKEDIIVTRQPNKKGNYLIFFKPGFEYNMLIQAKGYKTRMIKFRVPEQNYYFPLRQKIVIEPINLLGEKVGERFELNNYFQNFPYDTTSAENITVLENNENQEKMEEAVERIAEYNRQKEEKDKDEKKYRQLMDFIDKSIRNSDTAALRRLKQQTNYDKKVTDKTYYAEEEKTPQKVKINGETYRVHQRIDLTDEALSAREVSLDELVKSHQMTADNKADSLTDKKPEKRRTEIKKVKIFFRHNQYELKPKFREKLDEVARFLLDNSRMNVEIHGYANDIGREQPNYVLSKSRANAVKQYLFQKNIEADRIETYFHGELKSTDDEQLKYNRRADIHIYSN